MSIDPEIVLAVDNCFASKRWIEPEEWLGILADMGIGHVEAGADNECDPLYQGVTALRRWVRKVRRAEDATGARVINLYSGHGTYATIGLAHPDAAVRRRMLEKWLKPMAALAGELGAGLGFFCHAFPERFLASPAAFSAARERLFDALAELSEYAGGCGCGKIGLEQMYSPHQIPWRLKDAELLLREVFRRSSEPFYLTIDVGHQCGQRRFVRPEFLENDGRPGFPADAWLGSGAVRRELSQAVSRREAEEALERYEYLFSEAADGSTTRWLEEFGRWSPIVHLQQHRENSSGHLAFTPSNNEAGVVEPGAVLAALRRGCARGGREELPPVCESIALTLELFSGTADAPEVILEDLKTSIEFWRRAIPGDGMRLSALPDDNLKYGEVIFSHE